jgi:CheY-like chemotaxis protein
MRPRHALIIEDEILIAMEIEELLKEQGFDTVDVADSPLEALDKALRRKPDLITADYRIVGGTGVEAVSMIMAHLGPIPVVYVTGHAKALADQDTGVVVQKPILPRVLTGAWHQALEAA